MSAMNDIVKLGIDSYKGRVTEYSADKTQEALRNALIEANGGSTIIDARAMRDGKCVGAFAIVEQILAGVVADDILNDPFFKAMVEFRNVAAGDEAVFNLENTALFEVATIAEGTQAIRRQRIVDYTEVLVKTKVHAVRIYEELKRVLAGRVDFNTMIAKVAQSFKAEILNEVVSLWAGATAADIGGATYFPVAGTYSEDALLEVIEHVEAAAGGKPATIIGTKRALRPLIASLVGNAAKETTDSQGYAGSFYGSDVIMLPQRHQVGTSSFVFNDKSLTIVASGDGGKPIKFVYEGSPLVIPKAPEHNMDLTYEYFYADRWGMALAMANGNSGIGRYDFT